MIIPVDHRLWKAKIQKEGFGQRWRHNKQCQKAHFKINEVGFLEKQKWMTSK